MLGSLVADEAAKVLHGCSDAIVRAHLRQFKANKFLKAKRIFAFHGRALVECVLEDIERKPDLETELQLARDDESDEFRAFPSLSVRSAGAGTGTDPAARLAEAAYRSWSELFSAFRKSKHFCTCVQRVRRTLAIFAAPPLWIMYMFNGLFAVC